MKQTIGVFFGSRSAEHDVSIVTALGAVVKPLEALGEYRVVPVYIAKDGAWYSDPRLADISLYQTDALDDMLKNLKPVLLDFSDGLTIIKPGVRPKKTKIDIAFPATHGTFGEDGALMGVFEMAGVPYVGCDQASSAVAMNKVTSKLIAEAHGIKTPRMYFFSTNELQGEPETWAEQITKNSSFTGAKLPYFVKPAHLGSSIGITRVVELSELGQAIEVAAHYDDLVLVEEAVPNLIEVTVPVIGNAQPRAALVERPLTVSDEFFDFDTKYIGQGKKTGSKTGEAGAQGYSELPAKLSKSLYDACESTALRVYRALGCSGIARVDLLIDSKSKVVYFNEINPMPGSLYMHNWSQAGVAPAVLVGELVKLALDRHTQRASLTRTFETNFLKQF